MDDLLEVRVRLQGAREAAADAAKAAAGIAGIGVASEEAAVKTRLTRVEAFALRQGLFTLRRELFYGTAAAGAFAIGTAKLGLTFDEARQHGTSAFSAILGSQRLASAEMQNLIGLTHQTGLQLTTLTDEAITMQGFGASIADVNKELAALGSFAQRAGLGPGGLSSLVDIFDRIRQSGKLTSLDIRTLTGLGVPAIAILRRELHLTGQQVAQLRANKLVVPSQFALPALTSGIGARADQLGTNLGQQAGIAHSFLSQILGGSETGLFSFATRGLERVNRAFAARTNGGSFLATLDPSGRLLRDWEILVGDVNAGARAFANVWDVVRRGQPILNLLVGVLGFVAGQSTLIRLALTGLAYWYLVTRTRMLLFLTATKAVSAAETAYIGVLYLADAATALFAGDWVALNAAFEATPIGLIITGVALLAFGMYELVKHSGQVGHAFVVAFDQARHAVVWLFNEIRSLWNLLSFHVPGFSLFGHHIGGFTVHVSPLGTIPGLAAGGDLLTGGTVMVGERGPELLSLPQAARVTPLRGGASGLLDRLAIYVNIEGTPVKVDGRQIAEISWKYSVAAEARS